MTKVEKIFRMQPVLCLGPDCENCFSKDKCVLDDNLWMLADDVVVTHGKYRITIKAAFDFDGVSVPRIAWTTTYYPLHKRTLIAGLVHDALYASKLLPREECDLILKELLDDYGVSEYTEYKMYWAVRCFGGAAYDDAIDLDLYRRLVTVEVLP